MQQSGKKQQHAVQNRDLGLVLYIIRKGLDVFQGALNPRIDEMHREAGGPEVEDTEDSAHVRSHLDVADSLLKIVGSLVDAIKSFSNAVGLQGHDHQADIALDNLVSLRDRYEREVVAVLKEASGGNGGGAHGQDERDVISKVERTLRAIGSSIRLQLEDLDRRLQVVSGPGKVSTRTVVSVDRYQYSRHAATAEAMMGDPRWVEQLNKEISDLIQDCINGCGAPQDDTFVLNLGDGATILFGSAAQAWAFVRRLNEAADRRNTQSKPADSYMHFRSGLATGEVSLTTVTVNDRIVGFTMAGMTVVRAVRLQSAAKTGQALLCDETYAKLETTDRDQRGWSRRNVEGKTHDRQIAAHAFQIVDPAPTPRPKRRNRKRKPTNAARLKGGNTNGTKRKSGNRRRRPNPR